MKNISRKTTLALLCASGALLLQACGGGGDGSSAGTLPAPSASPAPAPSGTGAPVNSGAVAAPFKAGEEAGSFLVGVNSQTFGSPDTFAQDGSGAVTVFDDIKLSGQTVVQDIAGDASFAMGRWTAGTVTKNGVTETLTGADNRAYHYLLYNRLIMAPTGGSFSCDAGTFSTPTLESGSSSAASTGTVNGTASLRFAQDRSASVDGSLSVSAGGASTSVSLKVNVIRPASTSVAGNYLSAGGAGTAMQAADAGNGAYQVVGSYRAQMPDGASYIGVYRFLCK